MYNYALILGSWFFPTEIISRTSCQPERLLKSRNRPVSNSKAGKKGNAPDPDGLSVLFLNQIAKVTAVLAIACHPNGQPPSHWSSLGEARSVERQYFVHLLQHLRRQTPQRLRQVSQVSDRKLRNSRGFPQPFVPLLDINKWWSLKKAQVPISRPQGDG